MKLSVFRPKVCCLAGIVMIGLTSSPVLAQPGRWHGNNASCPVPRNTGTVSAPRARAGAAACPRGNSGPAVGRPTHTAAGTPIRWVNVPVPNYAVGGGYGFGGFGFGGYGYGGFGYGGLNSSFSVEADTSNRRTQRTTKARRSQVAAPDPGSARNYMIRKSLTEFTQKNSVAGKIFLSDGDGKWLLEFSGNPVYGEQSVKIPCLGTRRGQEQAQSVLLILTFNGEEITSAEVEPNYLSSR